MKKIVIAGSTGFVGTGIVSELLGQGYDVYALVRKKSEGESATGVREIVCDLFQPDSYASQIKGCDVFINAIGIIREKSSSGVTFERIHTELNARLIEAAKAAGIRSYVLVSALGVSPDGVSRYQTSKFAAEQELKSSGLRWAVFRPSFVLGPGSGFLKEITPVVKAPVTPVFGSGEYRFEPVHRDVLAKAMVALLAREDAWERVYELRGEESYSYLEILSEIGRSLGKKKVRFIKIPLWLVRPLVWLLGWLPFFPITMDQLNMLVQGNTGDGMNAVEEFGISWYGLEEALERS